jgi:predicted secreted protein
LRTGELNQETLPLRRRHTTRLTRIILAATKPSCTEPVTGSDMNNNKNRAMEDLAENFGEAVFLENGKRR